MAMVWWWFDASLCGMRAVCGRGGRVNPPSREIMNEERSGSDVCNTLP